MGKGQKSINISEKLWQEYQKLLDENRDFFERWEVSTVPELVRVLAKHGIEPVREMLLEFRKLHMKKTQSQKEH